MLKNFVVFSLLTGIGLYGAGCGTDAEEGDEQDSTALCAPRPTCNVSPPAVAKNTRNHTIASTLIQTGKANHRIRDGLFLANGAQTVVMHAAYSQLGAVFADVSLPDERVQVLLLRDCSTWETVGTYTTSKDPLVPDTGPMVNGVQDNGGRVFVDFSKLSKPLGVGRHRIRMVVTSDLTAADGYVEVLPAGAKIAVTDIDGTLTTSEYASASDVFNIEPAANPGAADTLTTLSQRGYFIYYLTARPEWLTQKTRNWMVDKGFPTGIIHTTTSFTGGTGATAADFKKVDLTALKSATGAVPGYAFGNQPTDVDAYTTDGVPAAHSYYFKLTGTDLKGGVLNTDYTKLPATLASIPSVCTSN